ncbi:MULTISPECIES: lipid-A-disaccharide synthase [Sinorhizobium]|uniref:Lipid-A-disaccharide synthase n=1 Tax=Sinorhizobium americanum TaxID=194963 RepID=A0A2S3YVX9_9HYPH|nr:MULTISPECIES: lipid-A-disaccharide synthase [Sinorhizobium]PDT39862.1 lipid-A-disaccharide synthase [Sinorhizobium sp. FG01]POH35783.1 lipid-A-disaccharide synthase [Sinorhizobium americanum]
MNGRKYRLAVIAGEVSGDLLGADLVRTLKGRMGAPIELVGVGGDALEAEGLVSLFDYSELSIMGFSQVLARLPKLLLRIRQTARAIVAARPDALVIIDSPDFTHRVARQVRDAMPDMPIIDYVCPSVWAWKPERAPRMLGYVDHVLAVLPFEPAVMATLGGPPTSYVGHRLASDANLLAVREHRRQRLQTGRGQGGKTCLLLPGSRASEISRLLPVFAEAVAEIAARNPGTRFLLPTVPRQEHRVRELTASWKIQPEITVDPEMKWRAFGEADAAIAASGTVILELALAGVPVVSTYRADWLVTLLHEKIRIWTAALPNLIADFPIVPEYFNKAIRPGTLTRWFERLSSDTPQRAAMLDGFALVQQRMATDSPPGEKAAEIVMNFLQKKKPGQS